MRAVPARAGRFEGVLLVVILLVVAGFAGAASFTHVKDWTMQNSPAGTGEWFGWANAVISELVPVAALLTIRRRKRIGAPIGYPVFLLIAGGCLSLAAQLAVAKPSPSGWLLSAVPALAFMALVKLVLTTTPAQPADPPKPAVLPAEEVEPVEQPKPAVVPVEVAQPARPVEEAASAVVMTSAPAGPVPVAADSVPASVVEPVSVLRPSAASARTSLFEPAGRSSALVPAPASAFVRHNGVGVAR
jgi:hypothetical protein